MRKKRDLTTWAFLKAPHKELSESFKTGLNKLGENENVDV
jgi:hypothetical protein